MLYETINSRITIIDKDVRYRVKYDKASNGKTKVNIKSEVNGLDLVSDL